MSMLDDSTLWDELPELEKEPRRHYVTRVTMTHAQTNGMTLEQLSDWRVMGLSVRTLQRYARLFKLRFPDYVPYELRTEAERKRK